MASRSWQRLAAPANALVVTPAHTSQSSTDRADWVMTRANLLFSAYRKDEYALPDAFLAQLGMIFDRYDDVVVESVTNPLTGIQSRYRSPPPIAAIVEACDAEHRRTNFKSDWDRRTEQQLRERELVEQVDGREPLEHRRAVVARVWPRGTGKSERTIRADRRKWESFSPEALRRIYASHDKAPAPSDDSVSVDNQRD